MYEIQADPDSFHNVERALLDEADGRIIRRTVEGLAAVAAPGVGLARAAILSSGGGIPHAGESIRAAIAAAIHESVDLRKNSARVSILALKQGMPRDFVNAPKRFNQRTFRRRSYGRDSWVRQVGAPGWFDETLHAGAERYRIAARRVLDETAQDIARKA